MTICVAAICNQGACVVVAGDRMVSAPFLTVEFDHPNAKIDTISPRCVALSSGDVLCITDILSESSGILGQLQDPSVDLFTNEIKQRFLRVRTRLLNERLFQPRGLSFENYYTRGQIQSIPADLAMVLDNHVLKFQLETSLIVAGTDSSGGHVYCIEDPGTSHCFDRLGYHAIGSGHRHAILSLVTMQHNATVDLPRAIYNVYRAKRQAEMAPGVGLATDMRIIDHKGIQEIGADALMELGKLHGSHNASSLDMDSLENMFPPPKGREQQ